jgi:hypothetical protein
MTYSGVGASAARQPKALRASAGAARSSEIKAEAVTAVQLRVGDLYWKQHGSLGWVLGQVSAFDHLKQSATFRLIDEATGEPLVRSEEDEQPNDLPVEQQVDLQQTPLFAANPLFR